LRGLEVDDTGSSLLTISKDKTVRILDAETWTVKNKYLSPMYSCASLNSNISVTGDEDRFVKMWDNRQGDTSIMTFKRFDEGTGPLYLFRTSTAYTQTSSPATRTV